MNDNRNLENADRSTNDVTDVDNGGGANEDALEETPDFNDVDDELEQLDQLDDEPE